MEAQALQDLTDFVRRFESQSTEEAETEVYDMMIDIVSDYVLSNTNAVRQAIRKAFEARPALPKGVICSVDGESGTSRKLYSVVRLSPQNDALYLMIELGSMHQFPELNSMLDRGILIKDNFLSSLRFTYNNYDKHCILNKRYKYKAQPIMDGVTPEIYITADLNSSNDVSFALNAGFYLNTYFKTEQAKQIPNPSDRPNQIITHHVISDIRSGLNEPYAMDIAYGGIERSIRAEYAKLFYGGAVPSSFLDKPLNISTSITLSDHVAKIIRVAPLEFMSSDNAQLNSLLGSSDMVYSIQKVRHEHMVFIKIDRSCTQSTAKLNQHIKSIVDSCRSTNLIDARTNWRAEFVTVLIEWFREHNTEIINGFRDFTKYRADAIKRNRSFASTYTNIDKLADTTCYNVPYTWKFPYSPYIHESYYVFEFGPDVQTRLNEMLGLRDFRFEYNFNQSSGSHSIGVHPPTDLLITNPK